MDSAPTLPSGQIEIDLAVCLAPREVTVLRLSLPLGATVLDALRAGQCAEADLNEPTLRVGVWGRLAPLDQVLRANDRVELYRALQADPKESRRLRYRAQHTRPKRK